MKIQEFIKLKAVQNFFLILTVILLITLGAFYLFSPSQESSNCPKWPESELFISENSIENLKFLKKFPEYGLTGLIYVNSQEHDNSDGCKLPFKSGEVFLFPGVNCLGSRDCPNCPKVSERPKINCELHCPIILGDSRYSTLHQALVDILTQDASDFMGFSIKYDTTNQEFYPGYSSYTCNPQWFNSNEIGICEGVNWKERLGEFLDKTISKLP
ncbi:MAG: hypothetical protein AAF696_23860 [Bacteroidota bacterium]